MANKVRIYTRSSGGRFIAVMCPGCGYEHAFTVDMPDGNGNQWDYNGDKEKPTFSPSMLVFKDRPAARCHSIVEQGQIKFQMDCFHELKGQTHELPQIEEECNF
jgi:Family of unknown function (DUF6527)